MEAQPMTQIEEQKSDVKLQYSCRKCRKILFTEDNLEEHMSKVKSYNTKHNSVKVLLHHTSHHYFLIGSDGLRVLLNIYPGNGLDRIGPKRTNWEDSMSQVQRKNRQSILVWRAVLMREIRGTRISNSQS